MAAGDALLPFVESGRVDGLGKHIVGGAVDPDGGGHRRDQLSSPNKGGVAVEAEQPALIVSDAVTDRLPAWAVPVETTRVRSGVSAVKVTSASLVCSGSASTC